VTGREVFSRIAKRYDRLNSVLSLGQDQKWRRTAAAHLPDGRVLDLGAGTGAANSVFESRRVVAVDPNGPMLALNPERQRVAAGGEMLPFREGTFDGVFSAYVFRNLESVPATMAEIARVLRPGGIAAIVDLGRPERGWQRRLHRAGTSVVLPLAGMTVGARHEYTYLHHSLDKLPSPEFMFGNGPLTLLSTWRMGPLGFVYGALLRK
jgi:demethylmenaquinone methyltransferase/2-methoxy-6-polyprenyl-1,4-benzoquinol methylase